VIQMKQARLLLEIARHLRANGSWTGETHVQKNAYLLQELLEVPVGFRFVLYRHGPFSFDLREQLFEMEAGRIVAFEEQPYPYGRKIVDAAAAAAMYQQMQVPGDVSAKIDFLAEQLGNSGVATLERIATAFYVTREAGICPEKRVERLRELKPHIEQNAAEDAFRKLESIRQEALTRGFLRAA
jgi:hypothetical protein